MGAGSVRCRRISQGGRGLPRFHGSRSPESARRQRAVPRCRGAAPGGQRARRRGGVPAHGHEPAQQSPRGRRAAGAVPGVPRGLAPGHSLPGVHPAGPRGMPASVAILPDDPLPGAGRRPDGGRAGEAGREELRNREVLSGSHETGGIRDRLLRKIAGGGADRGIPAGSPVAAVSKLPCRGIRNRGRRHPGAAAVGVSRLGGSPVAAGG